MHSRSLDGLVFTLLDKECKSFNPGILFCRRTGDSDGTIEQ